MSGLENMRHSFKIGLHKGRPGIKCGMFDKNGNLIKKYDTLYAAASDISVTSSMITSWCNGKFKSKRGYIFKYI